MVAASSASVGRQHTTTLLHRRELARLLVDMHETEAAEGEVRAVIGGLAANLGPVGAPPSPDSS